MREKSSENPTHAAGPSASARYARPLFGRDADLAELHALLDAGATLLLTGPPGIGKTHLAVSLGSPSFVDLDGVRDAQGLQARLASALACPVDAESAVLEAVGSVPGLLLDAADTAADGLAAWLPVLTQRTTVVLTARHRLDLPSVEVFEVGPLDPKHGAALLAAEIRSARLRASLDANELATLSTALDGVPLALVLVAPRLRLHPALALAERAEGLLAEATGPLHDRLGATVREAIEDRPDAERALLGVASSLPPPLDAPLLASALGASVDDALLELLDAGLVHPITGEPKRFRVLAPIRAQAKELAPAGWIERVAPLLLERATQPGPFAERRALAPQLAWLLAASEVPDTRLRCALALAEIERRTGPQSAIPDRDRRLEDDGTEAAARPELRVRWALAVTAAALHLGDTEHGERALDRIRTALDEADPTGRLGLHADHRSLQAHLAAGRRQLDVAERLTLEAFGLLRPETDPEVRARMLFRRAGVRTEQGRFADAVPDFRAAATARDPFLQAQAVWPLAFSLRQAGASPEAVRAELESFPVGAAPADVAELTWLAPRLTFLHAILAADSGDLERAREGFEATAVQLEALGEGADAFGQRLNVAEVDLVRGDIPEQVFALVPPPQARARAKHRVWSALVHACLGHAAAAEALGVPALDELIAASDPEVADLAPFLATALAVSAPEAARSVLAAGPAGPLTELAAKAVAGEPIEPGPRLEHRVLAALAHAVRPSVRIRRDGGAFSLAGEQVDIARRRVLRRVLEALVTSPEPLDVDGVCERVWPGESLVGDSGTRRVHVAISTLRGLGLRDAIVTVTDSAGITRWAIDPQVEICEALG